MEKYAGAILILILLVPSAAAQNTKPLPETFWLNCVSSTSAKYEMLLKLDRKLKKVYVKIPNINEAAICFENEDAIWMNDKCGGIEGPDGSRGKRVSAVFNKWDGSLTVKKDKFMCQAHEIVTPRFN